MKEKLLPTRFAPDSAAVSFTSCFSTWCDIPIRQLAAVDNRLGKPEAMQRPIPHDLSCRVEEVTFHQVESEQQEEEAGSLIREYLGWLNDRLQREYGLEFEVEAMVESDLSDPHKFHPPDGRFYLAQYRDSSAGVGCLKRLGPEVGEVQRMYVRPAYRGKGIGRAITDRLIDEARLIGYRQLRLESLEFLEAAHSLYRSVGFQEIDPYAHNSMEAFQAAV